MTVTKAGANRIDAQVDMLYHHIIPYCCHSNRMNPSGDYSSSALRLSIRGDALREPLRDWSAIAWQPGGCLPQHIIEPDEGIHVSSPYQNALSERCQLSTLTAGLPVEVYF